MPRLPLPVLVVIAAALGVAAGASAQRPGAQPPAECGPPPDGAICVTGPWQEFARADVATTSGAIVGRFMLAYPAGREIHARFDISGSGSTQGAEVIALANNETIAARVPDAWQGDAAALLGPPALTAQLAASLLELALPDGPGSVVAARTVKLAEPHRYLLTATPTQRAAYGAPWTLSGSVRPGKRGEVAFTLTLRYRRVGNSGIADAADAPPLKLVGTLAYAARRSRLPDAFDIAGWRVTLGGDTIDGYATLGELRRAAKSGVR